MTHSGVKYMNIIDNEEFQRRIEQLKQENSLFKRLMEQLGSFEKLTPHLQEDACKRMGIKKAEGYSVIAD